MKLEIARGVFLVGALGVAALALAAWEQPRTQVLSATQDGAQCLLPRVVKASVAAKPDHELLLFMFGMSQGMRPQS
ncbi:hypothetical protein G9Q84_06885 [Pseudomonas sp. P7]|jgi:hypothetical protein|uniref:Uncharacterized protein n=1 Tax=Pseudomonas sivasensis TaxID=1880678 RepID=A0ABW8E5C2_9PSED|nr:MULTISPECIES: hypothetical protein [Pseudomonas]EZP63150.1 hypothetical protein BW43_04850 [Pseudomonas sp. RIT357]MBA2922627.1 hypothetical protein [Pseudomonas sivasensis]MBA2929543.1 hypothetical protein [Pseudomonas sivasensis]MCT4499604.1 hypothetical protein [Pseudomonas sivasensis]OYT77356.1 MAG: hypothetical protein CFE48_21280 [Pseudomonas sp. PGPPP2]